MVAKLKMLQLYCLNYGEGVYELEDLVREEALISNLLPKLGLAKNSPYKFFQLPPKKC
jgi:hypothetical protein